MDKLISYTFILSLAMDLILNFALSEVSTIIQKYFGTPQLILLITQVSLLAIVIRFWRALPEGLLLYVCSQAYTFLKNTQHC